MLRLNRSVWAGLALLMACAQAAMAAEPVGAAEFFRQRIEPMLIEHCYRCHNSAENAEGGLALDAREALRRGGAGGAIVVPGDAASSRLLAVLRHELADLKMPRGGAKLDAEVLRDVEQWISQGAVDPRDVAPTASELQHLLSWESVVERRRRWWSLQPLAPTREPFAIDALVEEARRERGFTASPAADASTLVRRLYFGLIGLPPTVAELREYLQDRGPDRYARLVERLLASPHYGERWGRFWLDVVRYTESSGFEYDRMRDNAWPYRDYVIDTFNRDVPYDQFVREQIAGDVQEPSTTTGLVATSFLVSGAYDQAGNSQANLIQRAATREDELEDLLGAVGQTFLGLTLNCARCHDHKFDPISQRDYYSVKAVFEGVKHGERPLESDEERFARDAARAKHLRAVQALRERIAALDELARERLGNAASPAEQPLPAPLMEWTFSGRAASLAGGLRDGATLEGGDLRLAQPGAFFESLPLTRDVREKTLEAWVTLAGLDQGGGSAITLEAASGLPFDGIVFGERQTRRWMAGSENFVRTRDLTVAEETSGPDERIHIVITYGLDHTITLYRNGEIYGEPYVAAVPIPTFLAGQSRVLLGKRHTGGGRPWLTGGIRRAALYDRTLRAAEVRLLWQQRGDRPTLEQVRQAQTAEERQQQEAWLKELSHEQHAADALQKASRMVYCGTRVQAEPTRLLLRGDVTKPAEIVKPAGVAAVFAGADFELTADAPEAERRRQFANWLTQSAHPLLARVMVNRLWQQHFGQGLVATPSDLGLSGGKPSHPALLEGLAQEFVQHGWSVKHLQRLIVHSKTWQQASDMRPEYAARDADNRWLWRQAPRRLDAEMVRDAMLTASGALNRQVGGPSFRPFTTTEFNAAFYTPFDSDEPQFQRRTVYRMNVNSGKDPLLDVFDCPDPSIKTPRRGVTTTPLQALSLMNSEFVQRQAKRLADEVWQASDGRMDVAIDHAWERLLQRLPQAEERQRAVKAAQQGSLGRLCWVLLNTAEFLHVR